MGHILKQFNSICTYMPFFNHEVNAPVHAMKEVEVPVHSFLTLALDRHGQLHTPATVCLGIPWYLRSRRLGGPQSRSVQLSKTDKSLAPLRKRTMSPWLSSLLPRNYTEYLRVEHPHWHINNKHTKIFAITQVETCCVWLWILIHNCIPNMLLWFTNIVYSWLSTLMVGKGVHK